MSDMIEGDKEAAVEEVNKIDLPDFRSMDRPKLMQYASHLRLPFPRTATKDELLKLIDAKLKGRSMAKIAEPGARIPPGHAEITLLEDPMPGAQNYPVYLNCNGYECTIPRGRKVIVPMRVVRTLTDATVRRPKQTTRQDDSGREYTVNTEVNVPSYPFQVHHIEPGAEPLTTLEQSKLKTARPRKRYQQIFGYYPRPGQLQAAIEKGLISLKEDEELTETEIRALNKA